VCVVNFRQYSFKNGYCDKDIVGIDIDIKMYLLELETSSLKLSTVLLLFVAYFVLIKNSSGIVFFNIIGLLIPPT